MRRLRILCAGVWHNIFLAVYAAVIVYSLPVLAQPFYTTGQGVYVMNISPVSISFLSSSYYFEKKSCFNYTDFRI